jgi:hypothetical protein
MAEITNAAKLLHAVQQVTLLYTALATCKNLLYQGGSGL